MELLRTEREVAYYSIKNEGIEGEFNIDTISLEQLLNIVTPRGDDAELIDGYPLTKDQVGQTSSIIFNEDSYKKNGRYNLN